MSREPEGAPLRHFRCSICGLVIEIASDRRIDEPDCPRCEISMYAQRPSDVLVSPPGARWRSDDCHGCGIRIKLVRLEAWDDYCRECRASQAEHEAFGAHALDWRAPDPLTFSISDRLLESVFDSR